MIWPIHSAIIAGLSMPSISTVNSLVCWKRPGCFSSNSFSRKRPRTLDLVHHPEQRAGHGLHLLGRQFGHDILSIPARGQFQLRALCGKARSIALGALNPTSQASPDRNL